MSFFLSSVINMQQMRANYLLSGEAGGRDDAGVCKLS